MAKRKETECAVGNRQDEEEILITALKKMVNFFEEKYNLKK